MSLRESLNENPVISGTVVVVLILLVGGAYFFFSGVVSGSPTTYWYWYDLNTGERFVGEANATAFREVKTGSDPAVRAIVYACGDCETGERFIGHLEKMEDGKMMVSLPDSVDWVSKGSPKARDIEDAVADRCLEQDSFPLPCPPDAEASVD